MNVRPLESLSREELIELLQHERAGAQDEDKANAKRYITWRDAMVTNDLDFKGRMAAELPFDVGTKRRPTAAEWDAAIDAIAEVRS